MALFWSWPNGLGDVSGLTRAVMTPWKSHQFRHWAYSQTCRPKTREEGGQICPPQTSQRSDLSPTDQSEVRSVSHSPARGQICLPGLSRRPEHGRSTPFSDQLWTICMEFGESSTNFDSPPSESGPNGRRNAGPPKLPALFPNCMHYRLNLREKV